MKGLHAAVSVTCLVTFLLLMNPSAPAFGAEAYDSQQILTLSQGVEATRSSHKTDELFIKFRPGVPDSVKSAIHAKYRAEKIKSFRTIKVDHIEIDDDEAVLQDVIGGYMSEPAVEYAEFNYRVFAVESIPNDLYFDLLWGLSNTGQTGGTPGADIDAPRAWDLTVGSSSVVVAVIDTGLDYTHGDISVSLWVNPAESGGISGVDDDGDGYTDDIYGVNTFEVERDCEDDNGHGSHVAGIIGAPGNNSTGIAGVNWNVKIMPCKFLDENGSGYTDGAIQCLEYIRAMKDRGVNIVATNNSWGGPGYSQALYDAINAQGDILFIAAAGNNNSDNDLYGFYPANYSLPNVISVAATDHNDARASFSNYGRRTVHVGAPGVDIVSLRASGTDMYSDGQHFVGDPLNPEYYMSSGTSMAAPFVTGLAALIKSYDPDMSWIDIRNLILSGGDRVASLTGSTIAGMRVNAFGSLTCQDRPLLSGLQFPQIVTTDEAVTLSALSINCRYPAGPVTVTASAYGATVETMQLHDDGVFPDLVADDGIFAASWLPHSDPHYLTFSSPSGTDTIKIPLLILSPYLSAGLTGVAYHQTIAVSGGVKPYTWSVESGSLPPGLTLNPATGEIAGVPSADGIFTFIVQVRDADGTPSSVGKSFSLSIYALPDLVITGVSAPPSAATGDQINVAATVKNQGSGNASSSRITLYLSPDPVITKSDFILDYIDVGFLTFGESRTVSKALTIYAHYPKGMHYIGAVADDFNWVQECDENNNGLAGNQIAINLFPDLAMISASGPSQVSAGQQVIIATTVQNRGETSAGPSRTGIYLSTDSTITSSDIYLGYAEVAQLAQGAQSTVNASMTVPAGIAAGTYYYGAIADYAGAVSESSEVNNALAGNQVAVNQLPDLTVTSVTGPQSGRGGEQITITATVRNLGTGSSTAFRVDFYLSADPAIAGTDLFLGYADAGPLTSGSQQTVSAPVVIPANLAGIYYFGAIADYNGLVPETNEGNNSAAGSSIKIGVDLIEVSLSEPPVSAAIGGSIQVSDATMNQGAADAGSFIVSYYLSPDTSKSSNDTRLTGIRSVTGSLPGGATSSGTAVITIPTVAAGAYYLLACADDQNSVAETNETNNCRSSQGTIRIGGPDLDEISVSDPPVSVLTGGGFAVTDTVMNQGGQNADGSVVRYYLSPDTVKHRLDRMLTGSRSVPSLTPASTSTGTVTVTVPKITAAGMYYLIACADDTRKVTETNENNNCVASQARVQVIRP